MAQFTTATAREAGRKGLATRRIGNSLRQATALQRLAFETANSLALRIRNATNGASREDCTALAHVIRAWEGCTERIRILKGKPMPGSLRPSVKENARGLVVSDFSALDKATASEFAALDTGRSEFAALDQVTAQ
jgi:hypothetical protein